MITITVNGKPRALEREMSLLDLLQAHAIRADMVAVEHNGEILNKNHFSGVVVKAGDRLEIVRMMGGGAV